VCCLDHLPICRCLRQALAAWPPASSCSFTLAREFITPYFIFQYVDTDRNCYGRWLMHSVRGAGHLGKGLHRAARPGGEGSHHQRYAHHHRLLWLW
jgi:hypothetical protein